MIQLQLSPELLWPEMRVMRHAALHAQQQPIVWQQVFMKIKDTFLALPMSNGKSPQ
jgi:hypothetical protein